MLIAFTDRDRKLLWIAIVIHTFFLSSFFYFLYYYKISVIQITGLIYTPIIVLAYLMIVFMTPDIIGKLFVGHKKYEGGYREIVNKIDLLEEEIKEYHEYYYPQYLEHRNKKTKAEKEQPL